MPLRSNADYGTNVPRNLDLRKQFADRASITEHVEDFTRPGEIPREVLEK